MFRRSLHQLRVLWKRHHNLAPRVTFCHEQQLGWLCTGALPSQHKLASHLAGNLHTNPKSLHCTAFPSGKSRSWSWRTALSRDMRLSGLNLLPPPPPLLATAGGEEHREGQNSSEDVGALWPCAGHPACCQLPHLGLCFQNKSMI